MTDPRDYYPWPPEVTLLIKELLTLIGSQEGRDSLERELTMRIKLCVKDHPWPRGSPIRMPGIPTSAGSSAKELLKIYSFLHDDQASYSFGRLFPRRNVGIYYRAYRKALSELRFERTIREFDDS